MQNFEREIVLKKIPENFLAIAFPRRNNKVFFETGGRCPPRRSQMTGNAVKIGDGCATVTDYKFPQPLTGLHAGREGGNEVQVRSQDTGLAVLVRPVAGALLRKEKDEASRANCFLADSLNAFIPRFAGG